jgi:two-component system chemotaxis response regulator CheB
VAPEIEITLRKMPPVFMPKAIAIASSTGGPKALQIVMEGIGNKLAHLPIFITQHMPKDFTASLGLQLVKIAGLEGGEAKQGDIVKAGNIYLAPGDYHMLAEKVGGSIFIRLNQNEQENFCRPAADPMLRSLTKIYGKDLLVVVLTGMGQDGLAGARIAADAGGVVIAQDQITSVVWGMPGAVAKAGICNHVLPLPQIANLLIRLCI